MEDKMISFINNKIKSMKENYDKTKQFDTIANAELNGMMQLLSVATEKNYWFCDGGVSER